MKSALITGITGQDGSYLAEYLLNQGYEVWGMKHRHENPQTCNALRDIRMVHGDLLDHESLVSAIDRAQPDEIYNLAAISYVPHCWQRPELSSKVNGLGVLSIFEAARSYNERGGQVRIFQASSSEIFGRAAPGTRQNEDARVSPCTPHGSAKAYGHMLARSYRHTYGMFAVSGILYNHESPRRAAEFVSRKISLGVARIKLGYQGKLRLGDLSQQRDWGFAGDYVHAMHAILLQDKPQDFIIGTGIMHSVEELAHTAFAVAGLNWRDYVVTDTAFIRPMEPANTYADTSRITNALGWSAQVMFDELVTMMVDADLALLTADQDAKIYSLPLADLL